MPTDQDPIPDEAVEPEPVELIVQVQPVIDVTSADGATLVALGILEELPQPTPNP
ncbi:hypothetical protein ACFXHD_03035 [Streptomyces hydrogenans]|uniref:hypothetical protein n=1 Tax=Streptomyces hydrogenans TaxID=1873719 RepID=UPI0036C7AA0F